MNCLGKLLDGYRTIAFMGIYKNVGKTTTFNHVIRYYHEIAANIALTSIGRDGEDMDILTGTKKPNIYVPKGSMIVTAEKLLALSGITLEIHKTTDIITPMGKIVFVRARSGGFVQLGGAPSNELNRLICEILFDFGIKKILIDGAFARKSLASPSLADAVILSTGASFSPCIDTVVQHTVHCVNMMNLPICSDPDAVYLPGAVTDRYICRMLHNKDGQIFVANDPSRVLISSETYKKLIMRGNRLMVREKAQLVAVTVNPISPKGYGFEAAAFLRRMRNEVDLPVFDVVSSCN